MTFGLNTKEEQMIALSTEISAKLDTIISLLSATPAPPLHTLDDLYAILSDIHLDTMSMDAKLLVIKNALIGPEGYDETDTHDSIAWNVYRIRRATAPNFWPPSTDLLDLQQQLRQMYDIWSGDISVMESDISVIKNYLMYAFVNLGVNINSFTDVYNNYIETIRNSMLALKGSVGVPADALNIGPVGSRDVIQLLSLIGQLGQSNVGSGIPPADSCEDGYTSDEMGFIPSAFEAWPETIWAIFPDPPPAGIEFGTTFGLGVDRTELVNTSGNWAGWTMYVASDGANFGLAGDVTTEFTKRFPTNVWIGLGEDDTANLAFFVGGSHSLKVYLCSDWVPPTGSGGPWGGTGTGTWSGPCESSVSSIFTVTYPPGTTPATHTRKYAPLGWGLALDNKLVIGGTSYYYNVTDGVTTTNMDGVRVRLLAGSFARIVWVNTGGGGSTHDLTTIGASFIIPVATIYFTVDNYQSNDISPGPDFTVEICPSGSY